jgi:hypothetical protein
MQIFIFSLIIMFGGFVFFHVSFRRSNHPWTITSSNNSNKPRLRGGHVWVTLDAQPFDQDHVASSAKHLVVVAGHSVIVSGNLEDAGTDESVWWLLDYQRGRGMPQAIVSHIVAGIQEAAQDPEALLVFSGGETRPLTGSIVGGNLLL